MSHYFSEEELSVSSSIIWAGKAANSLRINAQEVKQVDLEKAALGYNPRDDSPLFERKSSKRRHGWDIVFAAPKSISVGALVSQDSELVVKAQEKAVKTVVNTLIEPWASVRSRKYGQHIQKPTRNLLHTTVNHRTNREQEPHLHSHLLIMNVTMVGKRRMALEPHRFYRRFGTVENFYQRELTRNLKESGIHCELINGKAEIPAIARTFVPDKFSVAHHRVVKQSSSVLASIKEEREAFGLEPLDPNKARAIAKELANSRHRPPKLKDQELISKDTWRTQIDSQELIQIDKAVVPEKKIKERVKKEKRKQLISLQNTITRHAKAEQKQSLRILLPTVIEKTSQELPDIPLTTLHRSTMYKLRDMLLKRKRRLAKTLKRARLVMSGQSTFNDPRPEIDTSVFTKVSNRAATKINKPHKIKKSPKVSPKNNIKL